MDSFLGVSLHKEDTYSLIKMLLSLAIKARRDGTTSLADYKTDNRYLQEMIRIILNGFETEIGYRILTNIMNSTKLNRIEYVHHKLIVETYRGIQENIQPSILRMLLLSHLGTECLNTKITDYDGILDYETSPLIKFQPDEIRRIFDSYLLFDVRKHGQLLANSILNIDDSAIGKVISQNTDQTICEYLYKSSENVIIAVLRNLPIVKANSLIEQVIYEAPYELESMENHISVMLDTLFFLLHGGEIKLRESHVEPGVEDKLGIFTKVFG
jgi:hypothetical protein